MSEYIATFIFFFAVIDPIGSVPVFIAVTNGFNDSLKRKIAIKAVWVAALVLIFFIVAGELILDAIQIPLSAFQIAGGLVLFLFALTMIFGASKPESEIEMVNSDEKAIFPLAIPSIASPGAMLGAVLKTKNADYAILEQGITTLIMLLVLAVVLVLLLMATRVHKLIGNGGASIISRVMGLILASVAINDVLSGIKIYFEL